MPGSTHRLQLNPQQEFTMKPFDVVSIPPRVVRQARGGSVGPSASRKTLSLPVRDTACARFFFYLMRSRRCPRLLGDTRAWEAALGAELQLATCSAQPPPSHNQPAPCPSTIRCKCLHGAQTPVTCWAPVSPRASPTCFLLVRPDDLKDLRFMIYDHSYA